MGTVMQALGQVHRWRDDPPRLQNAAMRGRGFGWKAERCPDAATCELYLCTPDDNGRHWHPDDPLAFAKWRVRGDLDAMPGHVLVRTAGPGGMSSMVKRGLLLGAVGLGSTAAVAVWLLQGRKQRALRPLEPAT